ncbi:hypothetical protein CDAR_601731 [Caerostris darwini]|uniref:Uncharacterized protein n=1 Tax=Caerostris darwini TaxID=1538125 RepID=A0AAV4MMW8_9ARAC|nr:hypothetical protein CDAR_601731 [Caerostris darwini]
MLLLLGAFDRAAKTRVPKRASKQRWEDALTVIANGMPPGAIPNDCVSERGNRKPEVILARFVGGFSYIMQELCLEMWHFRPRGENMSTKGRLQTESQSNSPTSWEDALTVIANGVPSGTIPNDCVSERGKRKPEIILEGFVGGFSYITRELCLEVNLLDYLALLTVEWCFRPRGKNMSTKGRRQTEGQSNSPTSVIVWKSAIPNDCVSERGKERQGSYWQDLDCFRSRSENMSTKERQQTAGQSDSTPPTSVIVWKSEKKARWVFAEF